ncbi:hypothetical protein GC173_14780 [bacterium]|nr:hypothetical protein [bacterium]
MKLYGRIQTEISCADFIRIANRCLRRIKKQAPEDFARLQRVVRCVSSYETTRECDLGEWVADPRPSDRPEHWDWEDGEMTGQLFIKPDLPEDQLLGVFVHELGHACTVTDDLKPLRSVISDEWSSEIMADKYASKWGFERHLQICRESREMLHHGPPPGCEWEEYGARFRLNADYSVERLTPIPELPPELRAMREECLRQNQIAGQLGDEESLRDPSA